jgi:predicted amidophosphoribosyltransferase
LRARAVATQLGVSCLGLLERTSGAGQAGRGRSDRLQSPEFVTTRRAVPIRTGPVLVVDDVRTTGATLSAAADALILAGLEPVLGVTLSVRV